MAQSMLQKDKVARDPVNIVVVETLIGMHLFQRSLRILSN